MSTEKKQTLALLDGAPSLSVDPGDIFDWPIVTREDEEAILGVLRDHAMSQTGITKEFEKEYAAYNGTNYALGCCNGTAGLLAAMWACGVGAGDEVICPSMTYWASAAPALQLGAAVHFADIEPDTLCLDPDDIEHRIGPRTRCIVVVHYAGHPADMDRILEIAGRHGIKVLEDNSHAHGALYKGRMTGTLGDIAVMSMMTGKSFAIGEAGMIVTDDRELYERCVAFGHYERTGVASNYNPADKQVQQADLAHFAGLPIGGCKHRMNQTTSAMGRVQLKHYPARIAEIQSAMNRFWDLLEGVPGIHAHRPSQWPESTMGGWYNARGLYRSDELGGLSTARFCEALCAEGVGTSPGANKSLHLHPVFHDLDIFHQGQPTMVAFGQRDVRQGPGTLPVSESITDIAFGVPWFKHDRPAVIEAYATAFRKVAENADALLEP
ncbi:MAG: DegT/DnrJ/EryC1/StrS family aminotransferase [Candidatus Pacebacteria bacterium]|nr:DegT/DnrJ/EryC1/StrS family aminotransferase [Candidatus Paceibacterota bacterium]